MVREASYEEIVAHNAFSIKRGWKVGYRHGISERYCARARNGVMHVQYAKAALHLKDGKVFVKRRGELCELTASIWEFDGKEHVMDLREKYLKSNV